MERKMIYAIAGVLIVIVVVSLVAGYYYLNGSGTSKKTEIVIGATVSLTGWASREGLCHKQAFELWASQVNANGGILGLPVKLVLYDDQSDTDTAISLYTKLITVDKVDLIIGPYSSTLNWAVAPIAQKYQMPMITLYAVDRAIYTRGYTYVFGLCELDSWEAKIYVDYLDTLTPKPKTVAIAYLTDAYPTSVAKYLSMLLTMRGYNVVDVEAFPYGTTDFTSMLLKVKALNPDVFNVQAYADSALLITRQMKEVNFAPPLYIMTSGPGFPEFEQSLGNDSNYVMEEAIWYRNCPESNHPNITDFVRTYNSTYNIVPVVYDAEGYAACQVMEAAIKQAGSVNASAVRDALANIDVMTEFGEINFTSFVDPVSGAFVTNVNYAAQTMYLIQIQNQAPQLIYPYTAATATLVYPFPPWATR